MDYKLVTNDLDYIIFSPRGGSMVEIEDIAVMSERSKGRGRALVDDMLVIVERNWPETKVVSARTRASNDNAHSFYRALGFRELGRLERLYEGTEDCVVFGLDVTAPFKTRKLT